tara:strand:- start:620 stop:844 length:225 start_codon:yes stop_codon:yes gene_type:complete
MNFSTIPVKNTRLITPLNAPSIKPKIIFIILCDEVLPSNRNNNRLVSNLKITRDIKKISPIEKNMIIVELIEIY